MSSSMEYFAQNAIASLIGAVAVGLTRSNTPPMASTMTRYPLALQRSEFRDPCDYSFEWMESYQGAPIELQSKTGTKAPGYAEPRVEEKFRAGS